MEKHRRKNEKFIILFMDDVFPLIEDIATWVVWQTKGEKMKDSSYGWAEGLLTVILYVVVGYLLYER